MGHDVHLVDLEGGPEKQGHKLALRALQYTLGIIIEATYHLFPALSIPQPPRLDAWEIQPDSVETTFPAQAISSRASHSCHPSPLVCTFPIKALPLLITGEISTLIDFQALKFYRDDLRSSLGTGEVPSSAALRALVLGKSF